MIKGEEIADKEPSQTFVAMEFWAKEGKYACK